MGCWNFEIIIFPEETSRVRRVKLHGFLCVLLISLYFLCGGMVAWAVWDYSMMRSKVHQIAELERENEQQRAELVQLSGRVVKIVRVLDDIRAIDDEDDIILDLEKTYDDIHAQHVNDQGSDTGVPQRSTSVKYDDLADSANSVLAYVGNEIGVRGSGGKQIARRVGRIVTASANQRYDAAPMSGTGSKESIIKKVRAIAIELGIAPRLALSMAKVESGFDPRAVSPKGAIGVLQLIPFFVCQEYEVSPEMLFDPEVNIRIGLSYMKSLLERFDENLDLSLAAYNAGATRVVKAGYDIPPIEETRDYVKKVKEAMKEERVDLSTPPTGGRQNSAAKEPS
jgi:hypothetical protein